MQHLLLKIKLFFSIKTLPKNIHTHYIYMYIYYIYTHIYMHIHTYREIDTKEFNISNRLIIQTSISYN